MHCLLLCCMCACVDMPPCYSSPAGAYLLGVMPPELMKVGPRFSQRKQCIKHVFYYCFASQLLLFSSDNVELLYEYLEGICVPWMLKAFMLCLIPCSVTATVEQHACIQVLGISIPTIRRDPHYFLPTTGIDSRHLWTVSLLLFPDRCLASSD